MKRRALLAAMAAIIVVGGTRIGLAGQDEPTVREVALAVSAAPSVAVGDPIVVSYELRNTGNKTVRYMFQERDGTGAVLPYPTKLTVRLEDATGRVLTENETSKDAWWSSYYTLPQALLVRRKADRVTIKPGKTLERTVELGKMLEGLEGVPAPLPPGSYALQLALNGERSNVVHFEVTGDAGSTRTRRATP